jgi:hypothetical protein
MRNQDRRLNRLLAEMRLIVAAVSMAGATPMIAAEAVGPLASPIQAPPLANRAPDANGVRSYDLKIPSAWNGKLAISRFSILGSPFFGAPWDLAVSPSLRMSYGLTNLSGNTLHVLVNYRTEGKGNNSGNGGWYVLGPGEHRWIETICPVVAVQPIPRFIFMLTPLDHAPTRLDMDQLPASRLLVLDSLTLPTLEVPSGVPAVRTITGRPLRATTVALFGSARTNTITATVTNASDRPRQAALWVGVSHVEIAAKEPPKIAGGGFFRREYSTVPAHGVAALSVDYELPYAGPHPILAYQIVEARQDKADPTALRRRDLLAYVAQTDADLLAWGAIDLTLAAKSGLCVLTPPAPVRERANLTAKTQSAHFLFCYRPGSTAERDIDDIVAAREAVYARLSTLFELQLPCPVQIDLYPDIEAKGLGSGTRMNVANTINDSHIAEVYNATTQVTPGHELAHIFSYHFPSHPSRGGDLGKPGDAFVEGFAGCFELEDSAGTAKKRLRQRPERTYAGMVELITSKSPAVNDEQVALVDFFIRKNPRSFKKFYVQAIAQPDPKGIDLASRDAYQISAEDLDKEWHQSLKE